MPAPKCDESDVGGFDRRPPPETPVLAMSRAECDRFKQSSDPPRRITGDCDGIHGGCGTTTVGLACQGSGIGVSRFGGANQDGKVTTREPMQARASTAGNPFGLNVLSAASLACITVPVPGHAAPDRPRSGGLRRAEPASSLGPIEPIGRMACCPDGCASASACRRASCLSCPASFSPARLFASSSSLPASGRTAPACG